MTRRFIFRIHNSKKASEERVGLMNVEKTDRTPCVFMRMTARAGSWRRVVGLDLMAPGCVDRVPHDSRYSRARGKTSLCRVWRRNSGIRHQLKSSSYVTLPINIKPLLVQ